ncbi:UNVERIFIED_ORG: hypothetical protein J2X79_003988 [Arthrobacter globiformis]|nr:hypothetical protein [Arthrobacter globiformis]
MRRGGISPSAGRPSGSCRAAAGPAASMNSPARSSSASGPSIRWPVIMQQLNERFDDEFAPDAETAAQSPRRGGPCGAGPPRAGCFRDLLQNPLRSNTFGLRAALSEGVAEWTPLLSGYFAKLEPPCERVVCSKTAGVVTDFRGQYPRSLRTRLARSEENRSPDSGSSHGSGSDGYPANSRTGRGRAGARPFPVNNRFGMVAGS